MTEASTCAHKPCQCTRPYSAKTLAAGTRRIDPNDEYCSDRCRELAHDDRKIANCECGHPECTPQATDDIPPMQ